MSRTRIVRASRAASFAVSGYRRGAQRDLQGHVPGLVRGETLAGPCPWPPRCEASRGASRRPWCRPGHRTREPVKQGSHVLGELTQLALGRRRGAGGASP